MGPDRGGDFEPVTERMFIGAAMVRWRSIFQEGAGDGGRAE